jgi:hypothetical protein
MFYCSSCTKFVQAVLLLCEGRCRTVFGTVCVRESINSYIIYLLSHKQPAFFILYTLYNTVQYSTTGSTVQYSTVPPIPSRTFSTSLPNYLTALTSSLKTPQTPKPLYCTCVTDSLHLLHSITAQHSFATRHNIHGTSSSRL